MSEFQIFFNYFIGDFINVSSEENIAEMAEDLAYYWNVFTTKQQEDMIAYIKTIKNDEKNVNGNQSSMEAYLKFYDEESTKILITHPNLSKKAVEREIGTRWIFSNNEVESQEEDTDQNDEVEEDVEVLEVSNSNEPVPHPPTEQPQEPEQHEEDTDSDDSIILEVTIPNDALPTLREQRNIVEGYNFKTSLDN